MPPPNRISILPFLKEVFFSKQPLSGYIKRNKLVTGLFLTSLIMFILVLFVSEQALKLNNNPLLLSQKEEINILTKQLSEYKNKDVLLQQCLSDKEKTTCTNTVITGTKRRSPKPEKQPPKEPTILNRNYDNSLEKKLNSIRNN